MGESCRWKVAVTDDCAGSGACLGAAPKRFALGDDGKAHPTARLIEPDEAVLDAAAGCPTGAILVHDAETGAPVDP